MSCDDYSSDDDSLVIEKRPDYDSYEGMKREFMRLKELDDERVKMPIKVKCEYSVIPSFRHYLGIFLYYVSFGYTTPPPHVRFQYEIEDAVANDVMRLIYTFAEHVCDETDNLLFRDHFSRRDHDRNIARSNYFYKLQDKYIPGKKVMTSLACMLQYVLVLSDIIGYDIPAYEFISSLYDQVSPRYE